MHKFDPDVQRWADVAQVLSRSILCTRLD